MKKLFSKSEFEFYKPDSSEELSLPFYGDIACGFPSPADDFVDESIDLNKLLIKHRDSTFLVKAKGYSLSPLVLPGSLMIVDRSVEYDSEHLVACFVDGEFTAKWVRKEKDRILLIPFNKEFPVLEYTETSEIIIWGVITTIINNDVRFSRLQ